MPGKADHAERHRPRAEWRARHVLPARPGRAQRPTSQWPTARAAQLIPAIVSSTFIPSSSPRETYAPVWRPYGSVWLMRKAGQRPLTPDDWAGAALAAIARGGVDAVAVETVAAELGATKGSFYWHFKNRDALIQAALDMWEQRGTEAVIEEFEREPDPAVRLKKILEAGFELGPTDRAEIALLANPDHPAAVRAVRRVAERRITYIAEQLEKLGWDAAARARSFGAHVLRLRGPPADGARDTASD